MKEKLKAVCLQVSSGSPASNGADPGGAGRDARGSDRHRGPELCQVLYVHQTLMCFYSEASSEPFVLHSWVTSPLERSDQVTFGSLLPPEAGRFTAAQKFHKLLGEERTMCSFFFFMK